MLRIPQKKRNIGCFMLRFTNGGFWPMLRFAPSVHRKPFVAKMLRGFGATSAPPDVALCPVRAS